MNTLGKPTTINEQPADEAPEAPVVPGAKSITTFFASGDVIKNPTPAQRAEQAILSARYWDIYWEERERMRKALDPAPPPTETRSARLAKVNERAREIALARLTEERKRGKA